MPAPQEIPFYVETIEGVVHKELIPITRYAPHPNIELFPNDPFYGTLRIGEQYGKNIKVTNEETNTSYWLTPNDLLDLVHKDKVSDSCATGNWQVIQKGPAHFIHLIN